MARLRVLASAVWLMVLAYMMVTLPVCAAGLPAITSFTPQSGEAGSIVTITGTDFTGATKVTFCGYAANFTVVSDTTITATVPDNTSRGVIAVTNPYGTSQTWAQFTINPPVITGFSPSRGNTGLQVTISGRHFTGATEVRFNGGTAVFTVNSDTSITATVPENTYNGKITVVTPYGTAKSDTDFATDSPTVVSYLPVEGKPGQVVSITGTNFTGATVVQFGAEPAEFVVRSATLITAKVPANAVTGNIIIVTPYGYCFSYGQFIVIPELNLTITSFTPISGDVGQEVTIKGTDFDTVWGVDFNGTFAAYNVDDSNTITTWVPENATTGKITVWTDFYTAVTTTDFVTSCPTITSINPSNGKAGDTITISGTNFVTDNTWVDFTGMWASDVTVLCPTSLSVKVPAGAVTGPLTVTTDTGTFTSSNDFTVEITTTSLDVNIDPGSDYKGAYSGIAVKYVLDGAAHYTGNLVCDSNGKATIDGITPGTYSLTINGSHWLTRKISQIDVNGTNAVNTTLTNGDADGNNGVDLFDYVQLDIHWGQTDSMSDLDGDGNVNLFDYVVLDTNFGAKGD